VKTKLKRTLLLAAALLSAVVGCGGNDGSGAASTYVYASNDPVVVPAQFCTALSFGNSGPVTVGSGGRETTMNYAIDGLDAGSAIRVVIISDSFYSVSSKCDFPADKARLDVSSAGPQSGEIGGLPADAYDFVVTCENTDVDCAFDLTWSATY
jgi:hypothetical protein